MRLPTLIHPRLFLACALVGLAVPAGAADAPRTDAHGDPLPDGAVARLGTVRWRAGGTIALTAFLPEGKSLLTVSTDAVAQVWDRATGKEVRSLDLAGPAAADPGAPRVIAFYVNGNNVALSGDGKTLACPGRDGAVHLWDVSSGKELAKMGDWRAGGRSQVALSGDGKTLVMAAYGQGITVWDTRSARQVRDFGAPTGPDRLMAYRTAFSPDGKTLVQVGLEVGNGGIKTAVVVWDVVAGKERHRYTDASAAGTLPAMSSGLSPDAKLLALPAGNKVQLIDLTTGKAARQLDARDGNHSLVFTPDGKQLVAVTGRNDGLTVWDVATGKVVRQFGEAAPAAGAVQRWIASGLSVSPDGKLLAWADGPAVRLVDLGTGKETNAGAGHAAALRDVLFGRDGKTLLTSADDFTLRRWDAATGKELGLIAVPGKSFSYVMASPDERTLAAGDAGGTIHLIDAATGKEAHSLHQGQPVYGRAVAFSPDSRWLASFSTMTASGAATPVVELFDVASGKPKHALQLPSARAAGGGPAPAAPVVVGERRVFFSPDSRLVAATDGGLVLWDTASGREERQIVLPQGMALRSAVFSPDGRTIAAEMSTGEIDVWEVASGQKRLTLNARAKPDRAPVSRGLVLIARAGLANPTTLVVSPDGRLLAQADNRTARLWDMYAAKEVATLDGHRGPITGLAFAPDGRRLATVSGDTTGLLWDVGPAVKKLTPLAAPLPRERLEPLWADLARGDGARAFEAVRALAGDPAKAVPFLAERVKPVAPPDARQVAKLIADLDADDFDVRASAHKQLEGLGELALAPVREALKAATSAEQRRALEELAKAAAAPNASGERLRLVRALEVLEMAGTPEAVKVLKGVADGAPDTLPTTHARAILTRLRRK